MERTKVPTKEAPKSYSRRRSQRLFLQVPVTVRREADSGGFTEETVTMVVNAHGALVAVAAAVQLGETLLIKNKVTGEEQPCRVAYLASPVSGKVQVGLEFIQSAPLFWRISFPPDDWSPTTPGRRSA